MSTRDVLSLVSAQADATPDAIAIVDHSPVTYRELMLRAAGIAAALRRLGLPVESPIAVLARRDADMVATLLAVWAVGGCYVPLDLDDPPSRQARMIHAAGCRAVVGSDDALVGLRSAIDGNLSAVRLDVSWVAVDEHVRTTSGEQPGGLRPDGSADGSRLAYVLFTSGSTGEPKGVEVEHASVVNLLEAARDLIGFGPNDRYLAVSTVGFDISVAELFVPLITGGSLLLRDRSLLLDPLRFAADLRVHGVTVAQTGPTVWSTMMATVRDLPRLRVAISTGEAIAPAVAERLVDLADEVWNLYGPTEATVWATGHRLVRTDASDDRATSTSTVSAPIGSPLRGVVASVVDANGDEVPDGVHGELWLGGIALARGYRGNRELTDDRFVHRGGQRWYRTGDAVVRDAGGVLHYFGRNDDQIKVRGVRIEPMEVETAITAIAGVQAAAATWFASSTGGRSIVAAVVPSAGVTLAPEQLHDALADVLPGPMIPSRFVFCESLPRSSSGKIDRVAIRAMSEQHHAHLDGAVAVTPTEQQLIDIWRRTLGIPEIGADDHFFTIGGDSLAAVTMMLDVEEAFGVSLPMRVVFEAPTVRGLAARIDDTIGHPDEWSAPAYIFPLAEGTGTPFFFCGVDLKLARRGMWPGDGPLYAVSQWAQGQGFLQARSVEHLAERQLEAITAIQPHGPYRLGGFSFGGLVAYELAHLLRARGEEVELLFLLDATEPYRSVAGPMANDDRLPLRTRVSRRISELRRGGGTAPIGRDLSKRALVNVLNLGGRVPTWQWLNYQAVHLYGRHPGTVSTRLVPKDRWPAFWYTSLRLAKSYVARPYDGRVAAVFMEEGERSTSWRSLLVPDAETLVLDITDHTTLFDQPQASRWLAFLRPMLAPASDDLVG